MRKLNNFFIKTINQESVYLFSSSIYNTFFYSILYYKYFFYKIKISCILLDKYLTWSDTLISIPSYLDLGKFKFIFFKRSRGVDIKKLTYEWKPLIPNDYDLDHYLNIYLKNCLDFFFRFFFFGFIKLVFFFSFWPLSFTKLLS